MVFNLPIALLDFNCTTTIYQYKVTPNIDLKVNAIVCIEIS